MRIPRATRPALVHPPEVEEAMLADRGPDVESALEPRHDLSALEPFFDDGAAERSESDESELSDSTSSEPAPESQIEPTPVAWPPTGTRETLRWNVPWSATTIRDRSSPRRFATARRRLLAHWRNDPFVLQRLAGAAVVVALAAVCVVVALEVLR